MFSGHFDSCSTLHPFWAWDQIVKDKDYNESVTRFMEHYDIGEPFEIWSQHKNVRAFFLAKYFLFTCLDAHVKWNGLIPIEV